MTNTAGKFSNKSIPVSQRLRDQAIRYFFTFAVKNYYRDIKVIGEPVNEGPVLVAATHGNGLLDPVLAALPYRRNFSFMGRNTIFSGRLLERAQNFFSVIPVYRKIEGQSTRNNFRSFKVASELLQAHRGVVMFPSAVNDPYRLYPLQRGCARIALEAEAAQGWNLQLKIQPVAIHYSHLWQRQSTVTVELGRPLAVHDYREAYEKNARAAVQQLTAALEVSLRSRVVELRHGLEQMDEEKLLLIGNINALLSPLVSHDRECLELLSQILNEESKGNYRFSPEEINNLSKRARRIGLGSIHSLRTSVGKGKLLFLSIPVLSGVLLHLLPAFAINRVSDYFHRQIESYYRGTISFCATVTIMTAWYFLLAGACLIAGASTSTAALILCIFAVSAMLAGKYGQTVLCGIASILVPRYARNCREIGNEINGLAAQIRAKTAVSGDFTRIAQGE